MSPTVHKHRLGAVVAAFLGLLAAAPAQAAAAPKIKAAYASDADRDGHVDGVSITWSKKVRGGQDLAAPFAFSVPGYKVTAVGAARGKQQRVRVAERPECDAGGSVRVKYRPRSSAVPVQPRKGKAVIRRHGIDMRRFDPPIPRITCAMTLDSDGDAHVDGVRLTYSRAVRNRAQRSGKFLFSVTGYRVTAVRAAKGRFLTIDVAEKPGVDSAAKPGIVYSSPARKRLRRYAVRAGRKGNAFSGSFLGTRDGVAPKLMSARTGDSDRDGRLDAMALRFSEPVRSGAAGTVFVLGMRITAIAAGPGGELSLALAEGAARGDARPGVWIAGDGVRDVSGNAALRTAVTPTDAAPPVMVGAITQDLGGAPGRIDTLSVGFSEPVAHARDGGGSYPFVIGNRRVGSVEPASGRTVPVKLIEATGPDTGEKPPVRLIPGAGLPLTDLAGNDAVEGFVNSLDGVAPVLLSATTADNAGDPNGRIDLVTLNFSEDVLHDSEPASPSFTVQGYSTLQAAAAQGAQIGIGLVEGASTDSGATPSVSYDQDGTGDIRDAAGNVTPDSTLAAASDGAAPILLEALTADTDDDGRIDGLATNWSEPLVHDDDTSAAFPLSASGPLVSRVRAADGRNLMVDLEEPAGSDTGSTPTLTYTGEGGAIRDAAGLEPAKKTWSGLTRDALPPRVVSATTGDDDPQPQDGILDSIDVRFSEDVVHEQESSPASFTATGLTITSAEASAGDTVELKLQPAGAGNSGLRPSVGYTPDGQADVRDDAVPANFAPAATIAQAADGARPVLESAATADTDDDGRLDRVTTSWSEPLDHPDDSSAPFPVSVEQFNVARVHAAAGQSLNVDLVEPAAADTGSAPDLTYTDGQGDPIRDVAGLEPAPLAYPGLTRDALPPRLVSTVTADTDFNGKLDAIDIEWSEQVTGSTTTGPYTVGGRTLAANVNFSGARTRIPFTEDPAQHDTHDTPLVSYDAGPGDLRDVAEGKDDTTEDAPAVGAQPAVDKAPPILVAAKTADLLTPAGGNVPNGTIDAMLVTFSEPISHGVDGIAPFSLNVAGRNETEIEGDTGPTDRTLYVAVSESGTPDGGEKPNVSVTSAGAVPDRIKDRATVPNEARVMTFTGTTDEVRPVLMSAQLGERGTSGGCTKTAVDGIDGEVDCVLTTWSEDVQHAEDTVAPFSIVPTYWTVDAAGIGALPSAKTLEIPLTPTGSKDRDRSGESVSYNDAIDTPVVDTAALPNESLNGTKPAEPACKDTGLEGNDVLSAAITDPLLELETTSPSFQRKCAFDPDWYELVTTADGYLDILTRPSNGVDIKFDLFTAAGDPVAPTTIVETGAAGQLDRIKYQGLSATTPYYVRISATDTPSPQEGPYCVVYSDNAAVEPGCGPLVGQIVFTEVGFGNDKFVEVKNDFDVPVDMDGAGAKLILGPLGSGRDCTLDLPTGGSAHTTIDPEEHVLIEATASTTTFGCDEIPSLAPGGERVELSANGAIDVVDFGGIINSPVAAGHSLQFVEDELLEAAEANNDVDERWCRTYAADTKGTTGDGCDEYRINEVLWRPALTSGLSDGKAFVELGGNIPALPNSKLLGGWVLRGVNGLTGDGSSDFALPAAASPRANGTYVVADGVSGATTVSDYDIVWDFLDLNSPLWPDGTGMLGPRGLQLLLPNPPGAPPCTGSADAFGWTTTAQGFTKPLDDLRSCPGREGSEYTTSTVGVSAARDNLSSSGDTSYNEARDTGNNRDDFCPQATPNPGQLNIRPSC